MAEAKARAAAAGKTRAIKPKPAEAAKPETDLVGKALGDMAAMAEVFLAAKNGDRLSKAHELRKAANRLYAAERGDRV